MIFPLQSLRIYNFGRGFFDPSHFLNSGHLRPFQTPATNASPTRATARNNKVLRPTFSLPVIKGCIFPQVTVHRKRKEPARSAINVILAVLPGSAAVSRL